MSTYVEGKLHPDLVLNNSEHYSHERGDSKGWPVTLIERKLRLALMYPFIMPTKTV